MNTAWRYGVEWLSFSKCIEKRWEVQKRCHYSTDAGLFSKHLETVIRDFAYNEARFWLLRQLCTDIRAIIDRYWWRNIYTFGFFAWKPQHKSSREFHSVFWSAARNTQEIFYRINALRTEFAGNVLRPNLLLQLGQLHFNTGLKLDFCRVYFRTWNDDTSFDCSIAAYLQRNDE